MFIANKNRLKDIENKPVFTSEEREKRSGKLGIWGLETEPTMCKIDKQQRYTGDYKPLS